MMKNVIGVCCGLLASTAVLAAQTPSTPTQTPPTTSSQSSSMQSSGKTVTLTGCVTPDLTSSPSASSSSSTSASSSRRFMLSNIDPQSGAMSSSATSYLLSPSADVNLSEHLNHKVQITGTIDNASTSSSTSSQSTSPSTSSSTQSSTASAAPTFRVTSVKMVSATCP
jgi:hypothetical protein